MSGLLLASAGDDIKLWDCDNFACVKQFNPHSRNISSTTWSHDNSVLGSASTGGDKLALTYVNSGDVVKDIAVGQNRTCLAFNSTSRYVIGGGTDGVIHVWDLKTHKIKKSYEEHNAAITSLQFNWNDSYVASASEAGKIILYSVVTGQASSPLTTHKAQAIKQLQYSHFKKALLGSVSDDGQVNLWDTNARRLIHSFTDIHSAPATGLAFSPINNMLLLSVGLDKRIVCCDVQGKKPVKTMMAESPLTSIDLMSDGTTLAVGSTRGKVYIYDLRKGATPIQTMTAHKSSVQCLSFQSAAKSSKGDSTRSKSVPTPAIGQRILEDTSSRYRPASKTPVHENPSERGEFTDITNRVHFQSNDSRDGRNSSSYNEIFSPIRDAISTPAVHKNGIDHNDYPERARGGSYGLSHDDAVFSPLAEDGIRERRGDGASEPTPYSSRSRHLPRTTWEETEEFSTHTSNGDPERYAYGGHHGYQSDFSSKSGSSSHDAAESRLQARMDELGITGKRASVDHSVTTPTDVQPASSIGTPCKERPPQSYSPPDRTNSPSSHSSYNDSFHKQTMSPPSQHKRIEDPDVLNKSSDVEERVDSKVRDVVGEENGPRMQGDGVTLVQPFQTEFIKTLMEDSLEEFKDIIRQDVLNMHVEMLKQFQIQTADIQNMLHQYHSANAQLLAENQTLKEENEKLRSKIKF